MKKGWEVKKLSELSNNKNSIVSGPFGSNLKVSDYKDSGIPILRLQNIGKGIFIEKDIKYISEVKAEELKYHSFKAGDITLAKLGIPIGKTCIIPANIPYGIIVADVVRIRPDKRFVDYKFLEYFLNTDSSVSQLTHNISGATRPRVNLSDVRNIELSLPPLPVQKRIVSILDKAFDAIAKAKENAEKNLKNVRELFESYLQNVFANPGDGWEEKRFDEICVLQRGFDLPTHSRIEGKYPLVSSNGITDRINVWKVKAPGVVTGRSGTIGNVHYIEEDYWPLNTALYIKEFHGNYERYVYYFLKQFNLNKYSSGAGVPTLNRNNVHSEMVYFPKSITEQKRLVSKLDTLWAETKKLENIYQQKLADLEELKKSILQKAFEGEL
jgi:type I restriction enzyme S subunit